LLEEARKHPSARRRPPDQAAGFVDRMGELASVNAGGEENVTQTHAVTGGAPRARWYRAHERTKASIDTLAINACLAML
jgi:hypothetical protein